LIEIGDQNMPRAARLQKAGYLHHVVCRGNGAGIFKSEPDMEHFVKLLTDARAAYPVRIYNFSLTRDFIHFLMEPQKDRSIALLIQKITRAYARYFNRKYQHQGRVFDGRYKSFLVQPEKFFFSCSRHIDMSAVKQNISANPAEYAWSGFGRLALGKEAVIEMDDHPIYSGLGDTVAERRAAYRALVLNTNGKDLNLENRRAHVLGDVTFKMDHKGKC
jgi:putative transposase